MRQLLLIAFVLFYCINAWTKDALTFNNVLLPATGAAYCMEKDDSGLLWIGTGDGLYCYDGYRCYHRKSNSENTPYGIQDMSIKGEDIYLACDNGFYEYNIKTNTFLCLIPDIREVNAILTTANNIYIGCKQGLLAWDITEKKAEIVTKDIPSVYAIAEYDNSLMVGALNGLYQVKNGKSIKKNYNGYVGVILRDTALNCFWIGAEGNLYSYDATRDYLQPVEELNGNYIKSLALDHKYNLYIGTDDGLFVKSQKGITKFVHDSSNLSSIQNNIICDIYIDKQQNIWFGNNVGFSMVSPDTLCDIVSLDILTGKSDGNLIYAISQDKDNNIWLGGTDGLVRCGENNADWYKTSNHDMQILHNRVRDIYNDCDGDVWILTDHGINLYDKQNRKLRNFIIEDASGRYSCRWAYGILMDSQRNMWITAFSEGVFVVSKDELLKSNGICKATTFYGKSNGKLKGEHAYHIASDKKGMMWIATNGGLDCINPRNGKTTHISEARCNSLLADSKNRVWIAFDRGLQCYNDEGKRLYDYYFDADDHVAKFFKILEIDGQIWAFSQTDCRVVQPDGQIKIFSLPDINLQSAFYSPSNHMVLLGGMDNVAYVDSRKMNKMDSKHHLLLANLRVNGHDYITKTAPSFIRKLSLRHDENNIEFLLTDIPDSKKIAPIYYYNIEGNDKQWMPLSNDMKITINKLPYGSYTLVVCAVDGMGNQQQEVYRLPITISPPWYLSIWAKLFYAVVLALVIWGIWHFYHVKKKLHEEEERRRKILEQQEMRSRFFSNLSVEIKKLLYHIILPAEKLLSSNALKEEKELTADIRHSATQINALIRQAFDLNGQKNTVRNKLAAPVNIIHFCRGFLHTFESKHPEQNSLNYSFKSEAYEMFMDIPIVRFDSIFNILLNYLCRYTSTGGNISLALKSTSDQLSIVMSASPLTTDISDPSILFERYNSAAVSTDEAVNSELYLAWEYVTFMDGNIHAEYDPEQHELVFTIILPLISKEQKHEKTSLVVQNEDAKHNFEPKKNGDKENDEFLAGVTSTIEKHISDFDFNVSMLQFELGVGEKTLYRRVKQLTGLSPVEYIRHLRMNHAALLLKEGNFTISEVIYLVGFSNSGYFSKCFQSVYSITPTKYKQKWKKPTEQ